MKKIILLALTLLSMTASATEISSKENPPFGLHWGDKPEEVSLIKAKKCKGTNDELVCFLGEKKQFNEWNENTALVFRNGKLVSVVVSTSDEEIDTQSICDKTKKEISYIDSLGVDISQFSGYEKICDIKNKNRLMNYSKTVKTTYGTVKLKLYRASGLGVIGTTTYKFSDGTDE